MTDWALTISSRAGDWLHTLALATITVEESSYSYWDKCCYRREETVIRLREEMDEELLLWAEKDRKKWVESITIMLMDNASTCDTSYPDHGVPSARVGGMTGVAGVPRTGGTA